MRSRVTPGYLFTCLTYCVMMMMAMMAAVKLPGLRANTVGAIWIWACLAVVALVSLSIWPRGPGSVGGEV